MRYAIGVAYRTSAERRKNILSGEVDLKLHGLCRMAEVVQAPAFRLTGDRRRVRLPPGHGNGGGPSTGTGQWLPFNEAWASVSLSTAVSSASGGRVKGSRR